MADGLPATSLTVADIAKSLTEFVNTEIMAKDHALGPTDELEAGGVDSMALLKVLLFVEQTHGFWIPDEDLTDEVIRTPTTLAGYIHGRLVEESGS